MVMQDSMNLLRVMAIIDSAGWLGEDAIGRKANAALLLVNPADARPDLQAEYLDVMREAVALGHAKSNDLAMLEDRVAVDHGRPESTARRSAGRSRKRLRENHRGRGAGERAPRRRGT